MVLGDGVRRNIATVSTEERKRFRNAVLELHNRYYPDGVSKWAKQDAIHQVTHVHGGTSFVPWHRELCNRFEELLREVDPDLSLHYWDWTTDPRNTPDGTGGFVNLFSTGPNGFMGSATGNAGPPLDALSPPSITRNVNGGSSGSPSIQSDAQIISSGDAGPTESQWQQFRSTLENNHNTVHGYIGGNIGAGHSAFEDPFVFLLHSNVDRLWAMWQTVPGREWRLDPNLVYGTETSDPEIVENLEPWAGYLGNPSLQLRPWAPPENQLVTKNSKHLSVIAPPCYDTLPTMTTPVIEVVNTNSVINFNDIPSGDTAARAAVFRVYSCASATIRVKPGAGPAPPFSILHPASGLIIVQHQPTPFVEVRIWLAYTAGTAEVQIPDGSITFECIESGQEFTFVLKANSIVRPRVAVMLALDQSGSMDDPAGTSGFKRMDVLKDAATRFMEVIPANSGVGLIRFDTDAFAVNDPTYPGFPVTRITTNSEFDADRINAKGAVANHQTNLGGATSVGDGLQMARNVLNAVPVADYEEKAIIVFTDGLENRALSIADVAGSIDNRTFAIGLGNEMQINTNALKSLTAGTGGYLMLSGILSASIDDYFRLSKYFLQILAGVTNNNVILDPNGFISPGNKIKIPFYFNEADINGTVILLADSPVVDISLESPGGLIIDASNSTSLGIDYASGVRTKNYKFSLPIAAPSGNHAGIWNIILTINEVDYKKYLSAICDNGRKNPPTAFLTHGARYSVVVNTYSNLKMSIGLDQDSFEPGSSIILRAVLTEYGIPVEKRSSVHVKIVLPDNTIFDLYLSEIEPGVFENSFKASLSGIYVCRFLAKGTTLRGTNFTREQTLNGAVFNGGDRPDSSLIPPDTSRGRDICSMLKCLLDDKDIQTYLKTKKINPKTIRECIEKNCT